MWPQTLMGPWITGYPKLLPLGSLTTDAMVQQGGYCLSNGVSLAEHRCNSMRACLPSRQTTSVTIIILVIIFNIIISNNNYYFKKPFCLKTQRIFITASLSHHVLKSRVPCLLLRPSTYYYPPPGSFRFPISNQLSSKCLFHAFTSVTTDERMLP